MEPTTFEAGETLGLESALSLPLLLLVGLVGVVLVLEL